MTLRSVAAFEVTQVRRSRAATSLSAGAVVLGVLASVFYCYIVTTMVEEGSYVSAEEVYSLLVSKASFAPAAVGMIAAILVGSEHRSRLVAVTLLRVSSRRLVLSGKYAAILLLALTVYFIAIASCTLVNYIMVTQALDVPASSPAFVLSAIGHAYVTLGWGLIGCSLGVLLRSSVSAVVALFSLAYFSEPALGAVLGTVTSDWARVIDAHLPFTAAEATQLQLGEGPAVLLASAATRASPLSGAVVFGLFVAALILLSYIVFERQDVTV